MIYNLETDLKMAFYDKKTRKYNQETSKLLQKCVRNVDQRVVVS